MIHLLRRLAGLFESSAHLREEAARNRGYAAHHTELARQQEEAADAIDRRAMLARMNGMQGEML